MKRRWAAGALALLLAAIAAKGEEEGEVVQVSKVNVGISVMLLGSIGFMMALFELTHCYKPTMANYTWKAISATISIFSAVLIFQGVNGIVEAYIMEGGTESFKFCVSIVHLLVWFLSLQVLLAVICGVLPIPGFNPRMDDLKIMEKRLKTWAILLGHITGFAAINCFASLQQLVPRDSVFTFAVAPLAWACVCGMGWIANQVRERVALLGDNEKTENEAMWDDETEETEDDVIGLATSFCFVQCARFVLGGALPNAEGEEPEWVAVHHTDTEAFALMGLGALLAFIEALRVIYVKVTFGRLTTQMKNVIAMTFSWCIFFGVDWYVSASYFQHEQGMMKTVVLALAVTVVALVMIFIAEQVEDLEASDDRMDEAIRAIVNAIGILIGFAWEKAFDVAVAEVTASVDVLPAPWTKMLLAIGLASTVVPAWYRHILPTIQMLEEEEEERAERAEKGEGEAKNSNLETPLLADASATQDTSAEEAQLKAACDAYRARLKSLEPRVARVEELEQKNRDLEDSIGSISKELGELQKLADLLSK